MPYARRLFAALDDGVELDFGPGERGVRVEVSCRLPNEGVRDYVDVERYPPSEG